MTTGELQTQICDCVLALGFLEPFVSCFTNLEVEFVSMPLVPS